MTCTTSTIPYVTPEGVTALYTPSAQQTLGGETVTSSGSSGGGTSGGGSASDTGSIVTPAPPGAVMSDTNFTAGPSPAPLADCSTFTAQTDDNIQLSTNFTLPQVTYLAPGNNAPYRIPVNGQLGLTRPQIICNLLQMCLQVGEAARTYVMGLGFARLTISSGFRIPNTSKQGSHHYRGAALDMQVLDMTGPQIFAFAQWVAQNLPCDQIILEGVGASHYWVHGSMALTGTLPIDPSVRLLTQLPSNPNAYSKGLILYNYHG